MNLILRLLLFSSLLVVLSCTNLTENKSSIESNAITSESISHIIGLKWNLSRINEQQKVTFENDNSRVTLTFNDNCKVAGKASINNYFLSCKLDENGLLEWQKPGIGMTMMAGPPELMDQETYYLSALAKMSQIHLTAQGLRLENHDGSLKMEFIQLSP